MRKLVLVVHTSLDGFVAGVNGELNGFEPGEENLEFVCKLTKEADAALFGRVSYQMLENYWPSVKDKPEASWNQVVYSCWYNTAEKFVVSKTLKPERQGSATIISNDVSKRISQIKNLPGKQILIFGSPTLSQHLMQQQLIDEYWIFVNPVLFGNGVSLFAKRIDPYRLKLCATKQFDNGEIGLHYVHGQ